MVTQEHVTISGCRATLSEFDGEMWACVSMPRGEPMPTEWFREVEGWTFRGYETQTYLTRKTLDMQDPGHTHPRKEPGPFAHFYFTKKEVL